MTQADNSGMQSNNVAPWRPPPSSSTSALPGDDKPSKPGRSNWHSLTLAAVPHVASLTFRTIFVVTTALYILNQQHALPRPLSALVSKALFWPTLPITLSRRVGKWVTRIDDTVVMGGAPLGFLGYPERLYKEFGVRGVINLCEEYRGPLKKYKDLGMEQLHLPTTDHFEPTLDDLMSAISFIKRHEAHGNRVYVHCRAGHGRSAATVFAWLMYKDPSLDLQLLNAQLRKQRDVRKTLWKQPNILKLHSRLLEKGPVLLEGLGDCEVEADDKHHGKKGLTSEASVCDLDD